MKNWITSYYSTTIGKKFVMAATGIILLGFVLVHMVGNLQIYQGQAKINHYSELLHAHGGLLWLARIVLLSCVLAHIVAAVQITIRNWQSRPVGYRKRGDLGVDYSARTMVWSGPIIAAFVVYHLLHLTVGSAHPSFIAADVYHNLVEGFRVVPVSVFYIIANLLLGMHLYHGIWSLFQTVGWEHPRFNAARRGLSTLLAVVIAAGNISIPVAVLTGVIGG
ncbi:MAG: succinate dehydrogenase cytochrome b subunit [Acidobacteria bacterium]|nr:succinate dehydrogenase cytochrome b subunit [Acidobacteriota bacterium]